jgi:subtilisin
MPVNGNKDWGFIDFRIEELWKITKGKGVKVAVLDSGLNYNLDDFKDNGQISFYNSLINSDRKQDCADDSHGHGTECSGIICGQGIVKYGVAPESELLVIKVTSDGGGIVPGAVLTGLDKAISERCDVISLSFSIPKNDANFEALHNIIKEAYNRDITILASVGDSGSLNFPQENYPASFPECLAIGGIDRTRKRGKNSSKCIYLDLMGPGEEIQSMLNPLRKVNGTSFSTPFAAGVLVLLKAFVLGQNKPLPNIELFDILKRTADINVNGSYNTTEYGWGILDPVAAYKLIIAKM